MKKIILITGSTDGIGKIAALKLAKDGHRVYVHGRNQQKVLNTISEIKKSSENKDIYGFVADFSDLDEVMRMAGVIKNELPTIDVLINNAGVFKSPNAHNKDGLDLRMVVNYLAPYVLTNELIPMLTGAEEPRLLNLSSAAQAAVSHDVLEGKRNASTGETYAQSKLALTMWSFYLAKKLDNISVIPVNPGSLLNTQMVREAYGNFWAPADKGANILYDLAMLEEYRGVTGKYFDNDKGAFGPAHSDAYNDSKIDSLIMLTEEIIRNLLNIHK